MLPRLDDWLEIQTPHWDNPLIHQGLAENLKGKKNVKKSFPFWLWRNLSHVESVKGFRWLRIKSKILNAAYWTQDGLALASLHTLLSVTTPSPVPAAPLSPQHLEHTVEIATAGCHTSCCVSQSSLSPHLSAHLWPGQLLLLLWSQLETEIPSGETSLASYPGSQASLQRRSQVPPFHGAVTTTQLYDWCCDYFISVSPAGSTKCHMSSMKARASSVPGTAVPESTALPGSHGTKEEFCFGHAKFRHMWPLH